MDAILLVFHGYPYGIKKDKGASEFHLPKKKKSVDMVL